VAGARHFTRLVVWQLADAIRVDTFTLTRRPPFSGDLKHRSQTEDAIDSVCRNIAEGFGCASHKEFARFLEISRRSLNELLDSLRSARLKNYVSAEDVAPIQSLANRLYPALASFIAYLRQTRNPDRDNGRRQHRRGRKQPPDPRERADDEDQEGRTDTHLGGRPGERADDCDDN
jgi:four helix bundle protein